METGAHLRLLFGKANKAVEKLDRQSIAHTGLNTTDFSILEALLHKGPLTINSIGEKILLTSGSMTTAVDRLQKRNLVERVRDPADGRRFYLYLTKAGLKLIRSAYRNHSENLAAIFACLADEEREELARLLKKVGSHADKLAGDSQN